MLNSNIFISYSHRDVGWKDRLVTHLSALQDLTIEPWDDTRLQGGDTWLREIDEAMEHARIAILLISADFLVSNFIRSLEVPRLLERRATNGLRIYPLIVRECPWRRIAWLGGFQARPLNATSLAALPDHLVDSALSSVAEEVQDLLAIPSLPLLPPPGTIVPSTSPFRPPVLVGLRVFPSEPLRLEFVLTPGEEHLSSIVVNQVAVDLISYFLACLTLPEESLWVNLSPGKSEKIIPSDLGSTRMGEILIGQDYVLKQFSASLMFPETEIGRRFWEVVSSEVEGYQRKPVNTFNKVWLVPEHARVWERAGLCLITKQSIQAVLEHDYHALRASVNDAKFGTAKLSDHEVSNISSLASLKASRLLLPEIRREVNLGRSFAPLRQIYHSLILAHWYREVMKRGLGKAYVDARKLVGLKASDPAYSEKVFSQYIEAYRRGVFDFIHEGYDSISQATMRRRYFGGGILARAIGDCLDRCDSSREQAVEELFSETVCYLVHVRLKLLREAEAPNEPSDRYNDSVGGIDLSSNLRLDHEQGSEQTKIDLSVLESEPGDSTWGLTPQILDIVRVQHLEQVISLGRQ